MNNVDKGNLVEKINNSLVVNGMSINQIAKMLKVKRNEIFEIMKKEGFVFDKEQGFFVNINEDSLIKRIEKLEQQQREILELLSNTKQKNELKIDNDILNGKIIGRSFKLYENTSKKFTEFCKNHPELKMQEIITVALEKYMEDN
ncbi:phage antirepressor KilAC domain-containing protein [Clostridium perfringens]|uniref:phage antirepressor KilAC domain-containing protein n=1 Tax=Clostridium perfringens TaxID=1502 RepID=UPI001F055000|nr:phage antirepressor KilAC domain-containing protein [Clostridium perfringens]